MYSFVIKISLNVVRAVLLVNTVPTLGLSIDNVDDVFAEAYPNNISVINNNIFFIRASILLFIIITFNFN